MYRQPRDPIRLEVFKHLLSSIAEEMGVVLRRTGYSPNIKERLDFSCAVFDGKGRMAAQAAHIPVHLGAMPRAVEVCQERLRLEEGDVAMVNDPYHGGTHLPDITLVSPVFVKSEGASRLCGFVANRAHHADVGGISPGSMPLATEVYQEGLIIPPVRLFERGTINAGLWDVVLANVRTPEERAGDLRAQIAANRVGVARLNELFARYGIADTQAAMEGLLDYAERVMRHTISTLGDGVYRFSDVLDDDGIDPGPVTLTATITLRDGEAFVDFAGTSPQCRGGLNAVLPVTLAATYYVFRALAGSDLPSNSGCFAPIHVAAPLGSVVNPRPPCAVAAGNVETSQRIVDVLLGALSQACPEKIPAASQGTMNNITLGGWDAQRGRPFAYYETIGGGMGARPDRPGASAIHTHMTNTLNTPIEAMEQAYPLRVRRYEMRGDSGGAGRTRGGDGILREIELLADARLSILSDRRSSRPYGLFGGEPGKPGRNLLLRGSEQIELPGKVSLDLRVGDVVRIETPGGGGYGRPSDEDL